MSDMNFKPVDDFILVKPEAYINESKTPGGIMMIKPASQESLVTGTVVAVGLASSEAMRNAEGTFIQKCVLHTRVGDMVMYDVATMKEIMLDGVMYNILKEGYLFAKMTPSQSEARFDDSTQIGKPSER